jgi:hypothetical protein
MSQKFALYDELTLRENRYGAPRTADRVRRIELLQLQDARKNCRRAIRRWRLALVCAGASSGAVIPMFHERCRPAGGVDDSRSGSGRTIFRALPSRGHHVSRAMLLSRWFRRCTARRGGM